MGAKISAGGASGGGALPVPADAFVREDGVITAPPSDLPAAGSDGQILTVSDGTPAWEDAPSVYDAWQFRPETYGAKGDGIVVSDATMGSASHNLACATSTPFTSTAVDAGKTVVVINAGSGGVPLVTTIATVTDSGHAVLTAASSGAVSDVGCVFGTDDTGAIQTAVNDAGAYASAHSGYAEVLFQVAYYIVAGAAVLGGATAGNAQITLPVITAGTAPKVTLALRGMNGVASPGPHWLQTVPSPCGATLISVGQGTNDGTNGPGTCIGAPYAGYGGGGGTFSNQCVVLDGLTVSPVYYANGFGQITNGGAAGPGFGGISLWGVGQMIHKSYSFIPLAVPDTSSTSWPYFSPAEDWGGTQWQPGLIAPVVGNNDLCDIWQYTCYGAWTALVASEHCNVQALRALYCGRGINPQGGGGGGTASHGIQVLYMSSEETGIPVSAETGGYYRVTGPIGVRIETLDLESYDSNEIVLDQGDSDTTTGYLAGEIHFNDLAAPGYRSGGLISAPHGTGMKLVQLNLPPGPVSSPAAAPANNAAWPNYYYRDAWITLAATTITAVTITGLNGVTVAQKGLTGSTVSCGFLLPSGASYTPTYTGTLTHTVTPL